mgnify:CR=1 FL=1
MFCGLDALFRVSISVPDTALWPERVHGGSISRYAYTRLQPEVIRGPSSAARATSAVHS